MEYKRLKYFKIAKELNKKFKKDLKQQKAHFRGNINSFSCISLCRETPELGEGGMKTYERGQRYLKEELKNIVKPKKNTPEKELQAYIIWQALNNNKKLPIDKNILYLTSEMAAYKGNEKIVADILSLNQNNDLVILELKTDRARKRLLDQVNNFEDCIKQDKKFFNDLVALLSGKKWSGKIVNVIVWPWAATSPVAWGQDITEICYKNSCFEPRYTFSRF
jgi:hypothetical protein